MKRPRASTKSPRASASLAAATILATACSFHSASAVYADYNHTAAQPIDGGFRCTTPGGGGSTVSPSRTATPFHLLQFCFVPDQSAFLYLHIDYGDGQTGHFGAQVTEGVEYCRPKTPKPILGNAVRHAHVEFDDVRVVQATILSRQFRGVAAAFGSASLDGSSEAREALDDVLSSRPFVSGGAPQEGRESITAAADDGDQQDGTGDGQRRSPPASPPFAVSAQVLDRSTSRLSLRCATIPAYLYGCREVVAEATKAGADVHKVVFPDGTQVNSKFQSIILPESSISEKVTLKSSTVGKGAKLGGRCRLNNVVIMDGASIGDNCILQNSVLGAGCVIGENCNLNDCQVAPGAEVPSLTKEKGESFLR